jgi:hypothetical protein
MSEPWMSVDEAAAHCRVSPRSIRRHAARLGGVRLGGRLLFRADRIDAALEDNALAGRRRTGTALKSIKPGANRARRQDGLSTRGPDAA